MDARSERGDVVVGWLARVVVALALVGVAVFDLLAITAAHFSATDQANEAASAARDAWQQSHDINKAYAAAADVATSHHDRLRGPLRVDADGTVHLTLLRHTSTLLVSHIGPLRHLADVTATVSLPPAQ